MDDKRKDKRKYESSKPMTLPAKYEAGFLEKLDGRTEVCKMLRAAYDEIAGDLGGEQNLSHVQACICERFVFLEATLRGWEKQIIERPKESQMMLSRWIQALNSLCGLAKTIGIVRVNKTKTLKSYIREQEE
jgi:hypothetical protein